MTTAFYIKLYFATLAAFFVIDIVWLGLVARKFYVKHLDFLMGETKWAAAIIFYLLFIGGILVFVVIPGLENGHLGRALLMGAFFGLVTYATYDLTNLATVQDWPIILTFVDISWGIVLSTSVTAVSYLVGRWLLGI